MYDNILSQGRQVDFVSSSNSIEEKNSSEVSKTDIIINHGKIEKEFHEDEDNKKTIEEKDIKKAVDKLNDFLQGEKTHVEFERHDKFKNQFIIKIIDDETKEVIKELPPKKILDMVAKMCELAGIMFNETA